MFTRMMLSRGGDFSFLPSCAFLFENLFITQTNASNDLVFVSFFTFFINSHTRQRVVFRLPTIEIGGNHTRAVRTIHVDIISVLYRVSTSQFSWQRFSLATRLGHCAHESTHTAVLPTTTHCLSARDHHGDGSREDISII